MCWGLLTTASGVMVLFDSVLLLLVCASVYVLRVLLSFRGQNDRFCKLWLAPERIRAGAIID